MEALRVTRLAGDLATQFRGRSDVRKQPMNRRLFSDVSQSMYFFIIIPIILHLIYVEHSVTINYKMNYIVSVAFF